MIDVQALVAETALEPPCGPELGDDPDFQALERAAQGRDEQQFGNTLIPAEQPDWDEISDRAQALFSRTKDLRVAVLLTRALTRRQHAAGLASGLSLIQELLTRYWDHVYPRLDAEDDYDSTMRLNALAPLAGSDSLLRDVRNMYIVPPSRHGQVSTRDVLVALGKLPRAASDRGLSEKEIVGVIRAAAADSPLALEAVAKSASTLSSLHAFLSDKVGADRAPDVRPLTEILKAVMRVCNGAVPQTVERAQDNADNGIPLMATQAQAVAVVGEVRSREEAVRLLDKVCEFIERAEPANPAPLFIRRGQRLMTKNFVEIIQDLAPETLAQIQKIAGLEQKK